MIENIKAATAGIADTMTDENTKLFPEVMKLVQNMPGGVSGLVKLFQDKGLGNVATSLTATSGTPKISPEQIVQGLGSERIDALATASGLDTKIVRTKLVEILPKVIQQLAPAGKAVEEVVTA